MTAIHDYQLGSAAPACRFGPASSWYLTPNVAPAATLCFVSHGAVIAVRTNEPSIVDVVVSALPTGATLCANAAADAMYSWEVQRRGTSAPVHLVTMQCRRFAKGKQIARTVDVDEAMVLLVHDAEFRTAIYAPDDVFIHAAVLGWCGRTIVIPGHSFSGKSTLAVELLREGALYFSDEYAVLDANGMVRPFPRCVMLRSSPPRTTYRVSAEQLGGTPATGDMPVGAVVATRYAEGSRWEPTPMTRGQMVLGLLKHAIDVQARPEHVLHRVAVALHADVVGFQGTRGDARATARALLDRLTRAWASPAASAVQPSVQ